MSPADLLSAAFGKAKEILGGGGGEAAWQKLLAGAGPSAVGERLDLFGERLNLFGEEKKTSKGPDGEELTPDEVSAKASHARLMGVMKNLNESNKKAAEKGWEESTASKAW